MDAESEKKEVVSPTGSIVLGSNNATGTPTRTSSITHAEPDYESGKIQTKFTSIIVDEKALEDEEWESDPVNPRNWTPLRKWTTMAIVRFI